MGRISLFLSIRRRNRHVSFSEATCGADGAKRLNEAQEDYAKRLNEAREGSLGWSEAEPQESIREKSRAPKAAREFVGFPLCLLAFSKDKPPRAAFRARGSRSPTWGSASLHPRLPSLASSRPRRDSLQKSEMRPLTSRQCFFPCPQRLQIESI